jgi:AraC-like DNA-binding protein
VRYRQFAPLPELVGVVECLWTLEGRAPGGGPPEPILPDGRPELILHFGDPFQRLEAGGVCERQPAVLFAGQLTQQLLLQPTGTVAVLGVRFHPHAAAGILSVPQHELAGVPIGLDAISTPLAKALSVLQESGVGLTAASVLVQRVLLREIDRSRIDPRVGFAVGAIHRTHGRVSIDGLADAAGWTCRHLERRFLSVVGLTPKRLARIARFQHALRILERESPRRGTETAAACGYADQSHFIRDFSRIAGCSPGEHLLRQGELTGFFIGWEDQRSSTPNSQLPTPKKPGRP